MDRSPSPSRFDWLRSWRGRREALAVLLFAVLCATVPILFGELYPFSCAPMFQDAPQLYCDYKVLDPQNNEMQPADLVAFGVHRNYWGNPVGVGTGFRPPATVDRFGEVPARDEVTSAVERGLRARPDLPYVDVVCEVVGPINERAIGVMRRPERWRVYNPATANKEARR